MKAEVNTQRRKDFTYCSNKGLCKGLRRLAVLDGNLPSVILF